MTSTMRALGVLLLVLALSLALAACRRDKGGSGGGYLPAPGSQTVAVA